MKTLRTLLFGLAACLVSGCVSAQTTNFTNISVAGFDHRAANQSIEGAGAFSIQADTGEALLSAASGVAVVSGSAGVQLASSGGQITLGGSQVNVTPALSLSSNLFMVSGAQLSGAGTLTIQGVSTTLIDSSSGTLNLSGASGVQIFGGSSGTPSTIESSGSGGNRGWNIISTGSGGLILDGSSGGTTTINIGGFASQIEYGSTFFPSHSTFGTNADIGTSGNPVSTVHAYHLSGESNFGIFTAIIGTAAGSGATVSITGNDTSGTITVTTGSAPSSGLWVSLLFINSYTSIPRVIWGAIAGNAQNLGVPAATESTSQFSLWVTGSPSASTSYTYNWICIQ